MASAGPIHLTAEEVFQSVCYSSRFTHRICDFSRWFISKIVVVVGEVRRSILRIFETSPILGVLYSCTKTVCSTRI